MSDWNKLKQVNCYRSFLKEYVKIRSITISNISLSAGFSRGFGSDIINNRRRLTEKSCLKFEKSMKKLPRKGKKLFRYLVAKENEDLFVNIKRSSLDEEISELRLVSWKQERKIAKASSDDITKVFKNASNAKVFATIGSSSAGVSVSFIRKVLGLSSFIIEKSIKDLTRSGFIFSEDGKKYKTQNEHLFVQDEKEHKLLKEFFTQACNEASEKINTKKNIDEDFFFTSYLMVEEKKIIEFKQKLKKISLDFIDDVITNKQENVKMVRLTMALHD